MARENATYRLELEQLNIKYPDKHVLTWQDVQAYTGCGRWWCDHNLKGVPHTGCTKVQLAHALSNL